MARARTAHVSQQNSGTCERYTLRWLSDTRRRPASLGTLQNQSTAEHVSAPLAQCRAGVNTGRRAAIYARDGLGAERVATRAREHALLHGFAKLGGGERAQCVRAQLFLGGGVVLQHPLDGCQRCGGACLLGAQRRLCGGASSSSLRSKARLFLRLRGDDGGVSRRCTSCFLLERRLHACCSGCGGRRSCCARRRLRCRVGGCTTCAATRRLRVEVDGRETAQHCLQKRRVHARHVAARRRRRHGHCALRPARHRCRCSGAARRGRWRSRRRGRRRIIVVTKQR